LLGRRQLVRGFLDLLTSLILLAKVLTDLFGGNLFYGTRMRLLLDDSDFRQGIEYCLCFDFELSGQLVDPRFFRLTQDRSDSFVVRLS
jgi:hypothetical protein